MAKISFFRRKHEWICFCIRLSVFAILVPAVFIQSGCSSSLQKKMSAQQAKPPLTRNLTEPSQTAAAEKIREPIVQAYGKLPFQFEVNEGQTDSDVKFVTRGRGYSLFLTPTQAILTLRKFNARTDPQKTNDPLYSRDQKNLGKSDFETVRMSFLGANPAPRMSGLEELPGKVNYFIGADPAKWHQNISTYARVKYDQIYPGIDLVYYGNQGQLEHDLVVAPGADPQKIRLHFEGSKKIRIDNLGVLVLQTDGGEVRLLKPEVYQEMDGVRQPIAARYVLEESSNKVGVQISFDVADYDTRKPLIIDPVLVYSTYLGGSGFDQGSGIAIDSSGNAYVTGLTASVNFPTVGPAQMTMNGVADVFVTKINAAGSAILYSTYLGGSAGDAGFGIAVDGSDNAYVTGYTISTDFPLVNPLQPTTTPAGNGNAFVAKLNSLGSALVYSTYLGGSDGGGTDVGYGIAVDPSGNAYVTGQAGSHNFPLCPPVPYVPPPPPLPNTPPPPDACVTSTGTPVQSSVPATTSVNVFVSVLNPAGSAMIYSTYLGGTNGYSRGNGIAVDSSGNAYVTGWTNSSNFPTAGPFQGTIAGNCNPVPPPVPAILCLDAFVSKINAAGSALVYSTYLGGTGNDAGFGIAVNSSGTVYVTGNTYSSDFPTASALQSVKAGIATTADSFITEFNASGSALVYSTYLGGTGNEAGYGISVDSSGEAYVTGFTTSIDFPTADAIQAIFGGGVFDVFVAKLNASGSALVYSTYLGGAGEDRGFGIGLDSSGSAYITGNTGSTNFPTASPLQAASGGSFDTFVAKLP